MVASCKAIHGASAARWIGAVLDSLVYTVSTLRVSTAWYQMFITSFHHHTDTQTNRNA